MNKGVERRVKLCHLKWKIKQFPNLVVRLITFDRCYICDECKRIHKRDGKEIRFDDEPKHLLLNKWWYGGVCQKGFEETMNRVSKILKEGVVKSFYENGRNH